MECKKCKILPNILADCWPAYGYTCKNGHYEFCKKHSYKKNSFACEMILYVSTEGLD